MEFYIIMLLVSMVLYFTVRNLLRVLKGEAECSGGCSSCKLGCETASLQNKKSG